MKKLILSILFLFLLAGNAFADTHYVSSTGTDTWADSTDIAKPCSTATANANAAAGDVVKFRAGTYTGLYINPTNSGTAESKITWMPYNDEEVIFTGGTYCLLLDGVDYHIIDGITGHDPTSRLGMINNGASYNEIRNSTLYEGPDSAASGINIRDDSHDDGGSNHNWFHDNEIYKCGYLGGTGTCQDVSFTFQIGDPGDDYESNYNTIEDNHIYHGGHAILQVNTRFNIIRNNNFHNECWMPDDNPDCEPGTDPCTGTSLWGNRVLVINDGAARDGIYNLVENNRIGHSSNPPDSNGADGLTIAGPANIVRHNYIFNSGEKGIYCKSIASGESDNNRIYNNTVYHTGYSYGQLGNTTFASIFISSANGDNQFKNNLIYDYYSKEIADNGEGNVWTQNWVTADGDPDFVNADISDPTSTTLPDLSVQAGSGVIDNGVHLTTVSAVADQTHITLADALYFQDGTWGSSLDAVATDYIAIGTVTNTAQISSINYSTNEVILTGAPGSTINVNDNVWLYKRSDGTIVLANTAPDQGAYEFPGSGVPSGTVVVAGGIVESEVVTGGKTLVLTLTGTTWDADIGDDSPETTALIAGIDSNKAEATGWDAVVKAGLAHGDVTRNSDTVVTILLPAFAGYQITESETITVTIDSTCVASAAEIVADPTFIISVDTTPNVTGIIGSYHASGRVVTQGNDGLTVTSP